MNVRTILYTAMTCILLLPASLSAQDTDERLKALEEKVSKLTDLVVTVTDNSKQLAENVDALKTLLNEQEKSVRALVESGGTGNPLSSVRSNMEKSQVFRQEFGDAVNQSIRKEGEIKVHNKTATSQSLKVNNRKWLTVQPGEIKVMKVPVGTVTTELVGQESPKNWTVGAPDYLQAIDIGMPSRITVLRPTIVESVREVTVFRPTIIEPVTKITVLRPAIAPVPVTVFRPTYSVAPSYIAPVPSYSVYRTGLFGRRRTVVFNPPVIYGPPVFWP